MELKNIQKQETMVTVELSLSELGTIISGVGRPNYQELMDCAALNNVQLVSDDKKLYSLYMDLKNAYNTASK